MKEFLQSDQWMSFQQSTGKQFFDASTENFSARGIFHTLPWGGKYFYVPRGPWVEGAFSTEESTSQIQMFIEKIKNTGAKWIRIEPSNDAVYQAIIAHTSYTVVSAPSTVQPQEIFVLDITPSEDVLLSRMKSKTRYNIRLAQKKGIKIFSTREEKYQQAFFDLVVATSERKEINPHPRSYYEKFFQSFDSEMCQLFVAEYEGEVLAANIMIFFEGRAIYLHGGSSDRHREMMAPFLLQWEQIRFAKDHGCTEYDFGGVHMKDENAFSQHHDWDGITRFKQGFSPETIAITYPGTFDIILDSRVYFLYKVLRAIKKIIHH